MAEFEAAVAYVLSNEGPELIREDNGRGCSKWGITLLTAREVYPQCTVDDIARMDAGGAAVFYRAWAWEPCHLGLIKSQAVATAVLDLCVNCGKGTGVKLLQTVVGVRADGVLGNVTAAAVNCMEEREVVGALVIAACERDRRLAAKDPGKYGDDLRGWVARRERMAGLVGGCQASVISCQSSGVS